ncbi:hypothetical protein OUHCRE10_09690 [Enterobacter hormaechei subsp. xiangfangensis]|nr:hypothetical protein SL264_26770 [Enterobacter cloacae]
MLIMNWLLHLLRQTYAGEANENIIVGYFDYISYRAAGGNRRIQDDFLILLPGSAPGKHFTLRSGF